MSILETLTRIESPTLVVLSHRPVTTSSVQERGVFRRACTVGSELTVLHMGL